VVQAKYLEIYELNKKILENFKSSKSEELDKYSINILITLLQVIPLNDWSSEAVKSIISDILQRVIEGKARLRKQIIKNFTVLLSKPENISIKLDEYIREFALKCLETDNREALLITSFLNPLLNKLRISTIGDLVYSYQKLLSKSIDESLVTHIYLTLETVQLKTPMSIDLSETLLKELITHQPSFYSDSKLVFSYIQCLAQTLIHMLNIDYLIAKRYISGVLSVISEVLIVDNRSLQVFAEKTMELMILNAIKPGFWLGDNKDSMENLENFEDLLDLEESSTTNKANDFKRTISVLTHLTSNRFQAVFPLVLKVLACFFARLDPHALQMNFSYIQRLIDGILELRNEVSREIFNKSFEKIVGTLGLKRLLEIKPFSLDLDILTEGFEENSNLWILNSMGKAVKHENLEVFFTYFQPLLDKIHEKTINSSDLIRNRLLLAVQSQIWQLLPVFQLDIKDLETQILRILKLLAEKFEKNEEIAITAILKLLANQIRSFGARIQGNTIDLAEKTIPKLVKFISFPIKNEISRFSLKSIGVLSNFCSKAYLDRVFLKNGEKLLEKSIEIDIKTFELLLEVAKAMDIRSEKLDISLKLVRKHLISQSIMQKRAYKLLDLLFDKVHSSFYKELIDIFSMKHNVLHSSRPIRASIIAKIWTLSNENTEKIGLFLQNFLSEIVLGLKESNRRTRALSTRILKEIKLKMKDFGLEKQFFSLLTAGFAGVSGYMKAGTIAAISCVFEGEITEDFNEILELIVLIMKEGDTSIFSAGLDFYRLLVKKLEKDALKEISKGILTSLLENDHENREKYKSKINYFMRKMIKRLGKDEVERNLPENHKKLVKAAIKAQKTEKKREKAKKIKAKLLRKKRKNDKEIEEENAMKNEENPGLEEDLKKERTDRLIEENPNDLLLKYDAETEKFHFIEHPLAKIKAKIQLEEEKRRKIELEMLKGKIIVKEMKEETGKKRRREDYETFNNNLEAVSHQKTSKEIKGTHIIKESGETFKAKNKSHGDLMLSGKPNPYAFIQLNPKVLNKRHRNVAGKAFEEVLGKKKDEGLLKGLKSSKKVKI